MNDIRRSILWVIFGFSLVMIWDQWQVHNGRTATFFPRATTEQTATGADSAPATSGTTANSTATSGASNAIAATPAVASQLIEVKTDSLHLTFDTVGGSVVKAVLPQHIQESTAKKSTTQTPVELLSPAQLYAAQSGLEALPGHDLPNHATAMTWVQGPTSLAEGQNELQVRFEAQSASGVKLAKIYTLRRGDYVVDVTHEVINQGTTNVSPRVYMHLVRDGSLLSNNIPFAPNSYTGPAFYTEAKKFQKVPFKEIEDNKAEFEKTSKNGYVAMVQHYFASSWLLGDGIERSHFADKITPPDGKVRFRAGLSTPVGDVAPGQSKAVQSRLFIGPQDEKLLERTATGLELVKDYGIFAILAKPLYWLLEKIHSVVGNWGWAIVLLVVLLKAAFYWLNAKAYASMAKMKAVTPKITEMRERLKDNPQQMQMEMMRIYREEKVNPMGGCLPMLIQMPVFIALYWVLMSSVEMRNAPWALWINDLASPDPWYILPAIYTATMLVQTWLNPTPADPMQAKMMWILPLVFSIFFFFFPAGLVLYWITNNVLTIAQQWFINKRLGALGK